MSQVRGSVVTILASTTAGTGTGTQVFNWGANGGPFDAASFYANMTTNTGATSLDIYIQTSWNSGTSWTDFIHFSQATTTTGIQVAQWARKAFSSSGVASVIATGDANLGAGKVVNGPVVDDYMRVKWVIAATTSYTFTVFAIADRDV